MNVLERDKLRRIIVLASELLKADTVSYAVDAHDDVKPDPTASASAEQVARILGPHYDKR